MVVWRINGGDIEPATLDGAVAAVVVPVAAGLLPDVAAVRT